jgi:hypothetical protein
MGVNSVLMAESEGDAHTLRYHGDHWTGADYLFGNWGNGRQPR